MKSKIYQIIWPLKVSKFRKQIFQPKLLPKNEPTNLFFYPDYTYQDRKTNSMVQFFGRSFGWIFFFDFYWPLNYSINQPFTGSLRPLLAFIWNEKLSVWSFCWDATWACLCLAALFLCLLCVVQNLWAFDPTILVCPDRVTKIPQGEIVVIKTTWQ